MFKVMLCTALAFSLSTQAYVQHCAPREDVVSQLEKDYGEQLKFGGLFEQRGRQNVLEFWVNLETSSFTVLSTQASGLSCIIGAGTDFFEAIPIVKPEGVPG